MIEHPNGLIAIVDAEGCISYLSPSVERILGYPPNSVMGRRASDFIHSGDLAPARTLFSQRLASVSIEPPWELRFRHQDGSWRTIAATSNNLLHHPAVRGLVVNARDVTKRKETEAAPQQSHDQLEDRVAARTAELFKTNAQLRQEIQEREKVNRGCKGFIPKPFDLQSLSE